MATAIALQQPLAPSAPAAARGFRLVCDLRGVVRLLCNLSGFGSSRWIDRLLSPRAATERIELVTEDHETLVVEASGAGRPLLLVHGLGGSHRDWDAALCRLASTHRVYTIDLRGHGTRAAAARPTLETMARDIALLIERLGLERPLLAGHSMGALVVMRYLEQFGDGKLSGVCIIDQSPRITTDAQWRLGLFGSMSREQLQAALAGLRHDCVETLMADLLRRRAAGEGLPARLLRRVLTGLRDAIGVASVLSMLDSIADADFRELIRSLSVPTLVVLGGASHHYGGLPLAHYYRGALARGTVVTYAGSAHSPHRQEPQRFAADLSAFAQRHCA